MKTKNDELTEWMKASLQSNELPNEECVLDLKIKLRQQAQGASSKGISLWFFPMILQVFSVLTIAITANIIFPYINDIIIYLVSLYLIIAVFILTLVGYKLHIIQEVFRIQIQKRGDLYE
ncbi:MAG: hypothetical protein RR481_03175 [Longicatena sp.]